MSLTCRTVVRYRAGMIEWKEPLQKDGFNGFGIDFRCWSGPRASLVFAREALSYRNRLVTSMKLIADQC
jgi:hypothetical protein